MNVSTVRAKLICGMMLLFAGVLSTRVGLCAPARVLGLDELIEMALTKSPEMHEAEQDIAMAQSDLAMAKAGQWAQLDTTGVVGPARNAKEPTVEVFPGLHDGKLLGRIVSHEEDSIGLFGRLELTLVQPLYTFGKISNRQDAAKYGLEAQQAAKESKRAQVILNVRQLYYALIVARQGQSAADDASAFVSDARDRIQRLIKLGSTNVDQTDLYRLDSYEAEIKQFKIKAQSGARMSYLALKQAVGLSSGEEFELDVKELPKATRELGSLESYVKQALDRRPEFVQLEKGLAAKKSMVEAARSDLYPSVFATVMGYVAEAPGREHFANSYIRDEFNDAWLGVLLGAQWHFDFGIGKAQVEKSRAEYEKLAYTKQYAEQNIPLEVAKYYEDAVQAQGSFQAYEASAKAARKWVVTAFTNFDMGVGTARDIFDAIDRYGKNQGDYLESLYNYHIALANLDYAIGEYGSKSR